MAVVDINNPGPTIDRINAATTIKELEEIRDDVSYYEDFCIASLGWEDGQACNVFALPLYFAIDEKAKTLSITAQGSPIVITVGGESSPVGAPTRTPAPAVYQGSKAQASAASPGTWLGLALLAGGAYYLWRYTRK